MPNSTPVVEGYAPREIAYTMPTGPAPYIVAGDPYAAEFGDIRADKSQETDLREFKPRADEFPERWYSRRASDTNRRHSVETQDGDGWRDFSEGASGKPAAPHHESVAPPEPRLTSGMSPNGYSYVRPFGQDVERQFNGTHLSMASMLRDFDIMGMEPAQRRRNTYRLEPTPYDLDLVDMPPESDAHDYEPSQAVASSYLGSRSYRL